MINNAYANLDNPDLAESIVKEQLSQLRPDHNHLVIQSIGAPIKAFEEIAESDAIYDTCIDASNCPKSGFCVSGLCSDGSIGSTCSAGTDCSSGTECDGTTNTCKVSDGSCCLADGDYASASCDGTTSTCKVSDGGNCSADGDCGSASCDGFSNTCAEDFLQ